MKFVDFDDDDQFRSDMLKTGSSLQIFPPSRSLFYPAFVVLSVCL